MVQVFRKAFRIVGLDGRKCRRVMEQDFYRNFSVRLFMNLWIFISSFFLHLFAFLHFLSRLIA